MRDGNPREQLEFIENATEAFHFLETEYGYRLTHEDPTLVTYESRRLEVRIRHGLLSYEIEFSIGHRSGLSQWRYALPEILIGLVPGYDENAFYQTTDKELLRQSLASIAEMIQMHAGPLLRGDDDAVRLVEAAHRQGMDRKAEYYGVRPVKERAHVAWQKKDYERVVALYASMESHLSSLEKRQYDYAKKQIGIQ